MSKFDESTIKRQLRRISRIEPRPEDTERAIERIRESLVSRQESGERKDTRGLRGIFIWPVGRFATAAALLVAAGYLAGRFSSPRPADVERLELALENRLTSSVEGAIRENLLDELNRSWQSALAAYHAKLNDEFAQFAAELGEQRRGELNEYAARTLAASNAVTHRLLSDLVKAVATAQDQDRQWVSAAMRRIESNRIQDAARLNVGLAALAETKKNVAQLAGAIAPDRTFRDIQENQ